MSNPLPIFGFGRHVLNQIETGITKEWIETNGLGSYAMGTVVGANTRRYHALFTLTTDDRLKRFVLANRIEESALIHGRRVDFSCQEYPQTVSPQGYLYLESFNYEPFPRWVFSVDDFKMEKRFFVRAGEETSAVIYRHLVGPTVKLILRPFLSCREQSVLIREDNRFKNAVKIGEHEMHCAVQGAPEFFITAAGSPDSAHVRVYGDGYWYRNLLYAQEEEMELDYQEDLYSPGQVVAELSPGQEVAIVFSAQRPSQIHIGRWVDQELFLRSKIFENFLSPPPLMRRLIMAADQFIVKIPDGTRIVTGYPWYDDTIRESMMSLPGLCFATGRVEEARSLLRQAAKLIYRGLLPQNFMHPPAPLPSYNNMDASLWFVWAVQKYWESAKDLEFIREMKPHIEKILQSFREGISISEPSNNLEIKMDDDGLIRASSPVWPLTWMDGKVGDWMATPRRGKAVEIQALWYNALQFFSEISLKFDGTDHGWAELAKRTRENFNMLFWNSQNNYLYDVIDGNAREGSIRPNAIFAISMPYEILDTEKFRPVFETAWRLLYTSLGLRTLSTNEPHFHGILRGDERNRVSAMHNGTVMPYLIGPFLTAYFKTFGHEQKYKEQAVHFLRPFVSHLSDAGLGTISEMFDGNPPHNPRGCVAESRGVAEILRVMKEEGLEL